MASTAGTSPWRADRGHAGAWTLWFDRPGSSQNTLGTPALLALDEQLAAVAADPGSTRLILRSSKPGGFCAGADLKEIAGCADEPEVAAFARLGQGVFARLRALPVPTLAVVHGACLGGGLELALACRDLLAWEPPGVPLRIGLPEVRLALVPGWGGIGALPRRVGLEAALTLLLEAEICDAGRAAALGLVDAVARDERPPGPPEAPLGPPIPAAWPPADWEPTIADARSRHASDDARAGLTDALVADLSRGWVAGLDAAALTLARLSFTPPARAAMAPFLVRRKPGA